jgi:hypothetical protein
MPSNGTPSVTEPESFHELRSLTPSVVRAMRPNAFQSVAKEDAVHLPERFRGGCSFGVGSPQALPRLQRHAINAKHPVLSQPAI